LRQNLLKTNREKIVALSKIFIAMIDY